MELTETHVKRKDSTSNPQKSAVNDSTVRATMANKGPTKTPATPGTAKPARPVEEDWDYVAARKHVYKPTTVIDCIGNLVKGCLGGGILGIPEAVMKAGLWTSFVFTIIFGVYITYCMHILVKSAQTLYVKLKITDMSYSDLAEKSLVEGPFPRAKKFGKLFRYAVDAVICIDLFGACCCYEIIIAKTIQQLVLKTDSDGPVNMLRLYIIMILIPVLLLGMIRSLKYLAPFSLVADFFIVMCIIATVVYALRVAPPISERPAYKDLLGFFEFSGVVVFSMEGIGVSLPIENSMKDPKKFPLVLICGMSIVVAGVLITGFFGYWGFGEKMRSPVTLNFPNDIFPTTLKVLIGIMIYITLSLNFWPPFHLVWYYLEKKYPEEKHWFWERVYRAIILCIITAIAIAFPNLGNMMGLIGSFCLSNMGFIFPAIIETLIIWEHPGLGPGKWKLWKNIVIGIIGVILFISGTYSNGKALLFD